MKVWSELKFGVPKVKASAEQGRDPPEINSKIIIAHLGKVAKYVRHSRH
jgi:hypothetical protein